MLEKLIKEVSIEILEAGINLERECGFKDVNGKRSYVEEYNAKVRSGRYNGVDGFYFRKSDSNDFTSEEEKTITEILNENGFKVIDFQPWEMEWDGDRAWNASVSFVKKSKNPLELIPGFMGTEKG